MMRRLIVLVCLCAPPTAEARNRSGVRPEVMGLPSGPGSVEGLGTAFEPSPQSGTGANSISIKVPPGVAGFTPSVVLRYSSGSGNGVLGLGWSLAMPSIVRDVDRRLPRYDATDSFVLRGLGGGASEELVTDDDGNYRFRIEGSFVRVTRVGDGWEARDRSGTRYFFAGATVDDGAGRVFAWNLTRREDIYGNEIRYEWERDATGRPYLAGIVWNDFSEDVRNDVVFDYDARPDALTSYIAGFAVTTERRLARINVRHAGAAVWTYTLTYDETETGLSRLESVSLVGRDGTTALPTLRFGYAAGTLDASDGVVASATAPARALGPTTELDDVDGDGLVDLLVADPSLDGGQYSYYPNLDGVSFGSRILLPESPSIWLTTESVELADVDGDGAADVIARVSGAADGFRYYPATSTGFGAAVTITPNPSHGPDDPDVRLIDLDHDRRSDWLRIDPSTGAMYVAYNLGGGSFTGAVAVPRLDPSEVLSFSGGLRVADVNGDGLSDLIAVRSGSFRYWPSTGYGLFAPVVNVGGAPVLSASEFAQLDICDIDGDGLADAIHVGAGQVRIWRNASGATLLGVTTISDTPSANASTVTRIADINGNGSADVLWVDPTNTAAPWRYLDIQPRGGPGLLVEIDNGLGAITAISYDGLGVMRAWARANGVSWTKRSAFGQMVVSRVDVDDSLGQSTSTQLRYSDPYFDGATREFRGFARVVRRDIGDTEQPTLITDSVFDVGDVDEARKGMPLRVERRGDDGLVFDVVTTTYQTRALAPDVSFAFATRQELAILEGLPEGRIIVSEWDRDDFGNVVYEAAWGDDELDGDEAIVERTYAINEAAWIVDRVASERISDAEGRRFSERRIYYDGEAFEGLQLGQVEKGAPTRTTSWIEDDRFAVEERVERDAWGNVVATIDGRGARVEQEFDAASHTFVVAVRQWVDDSRVLVWLADYDAGLGALRRVTDPNGSSSAVIYDALGRPAAMVQPGDTEDLPTTTYEYVLGSPVSYVRSEQRQRHGETASLVTYRYVDGLGRDRGAYRRMKGGAWAASGIVDFGPRGLAREAALPFRTTNADLAQVADADATVVTTYDAMGRPLVEREPDGAERRTSYAPLRRTNVDENGHETSADSDGLGRLLRSIELDGKREVVTAFQHDPLGNLTEITDALGRTRQYGFDGRSRHVSTLDANSGLWTRTFDDADEVIERRDPTGNVVTLVRDDLGRPVEEWHEGPSDTAPRLVIRFYYDAPSSEFAELGYTAGRLAWVEDEAGTVYFGYDERGRITDKLRRWRDGTEHHSWTEYDAADRPIRHGYPDGTYLPIEYDEGGLVAGAGGIIVDATWTAAGFLDEVTYGNGVVDRREYDARQRMRRLRADAEGGAILRDLAVELDPSSRVIGLVDQRAQLSPQRDLTVLYGYDDRNRLITATDALGETSWTLDDIGNVQRVVFDSTATDLAYDGAGPDQLTAFGDETMTYDDAGRLVTDGARVVRWGTDGRIASVERAGIVEHYIYDYEGRRAEKQTVVNGRTSVTRYPDADVEVRDGGIIRYVMLGDRRVARLDSVPRPVMARAAVDGPTAAVGVAFALLGLAISFVRRRAGPAILVLAVACGGGRGPLKHGGTPIESWPPDAVLLLDDHQGSVVAIAGASGAVVGETAYKAYGEVRFATGDVGPRTFVGNEYDSGSDLADFDARPYRPDTFRFLAVDPLALFPVDESQATLPAYTYARSSPATMSDPDGRCPLCIIPIVGGLLLWNENTANAPESDRNLKNSATTGDIARGTVEFIALDVTGLLAVRGVMAWYRASQARVAVRGAVDAAPSTGRIAAEVLATRTHRYQIATDYGMAVQDFSAASLAARESVANGARLYRIGTTGRSATTDAQFWALENPLVDPSEFAARYGIPAENVAKWDFVETATLKPGTEFITRPAPAAPGSAFGGGGIEAVVPKGGVELQSFSTY